MTDEQQTEWEKVKAAFKSIETWTGAHYVLVAVVGSFFVGVIAGFVMFH